ncbi:TetR/AcrR family transcriptional regulator [Mycobacterium montefiorense]|uniref:Mycofactocin system transcriptional regulator n=1 Tax=Mycobacterium montefiorense TaxID=154654 RepID=A0AA37PPQ9_9MYCO|nr:TetR/AcrR family transcriptional regulator [Mycobacterium montefiorense]GBG37581.1 mycofactocin system transcriptional regulator [Mycobacterium montefiorense]GKU36258.1 mycofactocin system transcriptional regulator [Mycobacterium montefiorense]GKU41246.1 mycofactocin system transcriptional regulator [Mycobacterium montefiorense]GKU47776.1 mycofactocin system transcriptional regulator [Mycobacterium montefiorense]GKU52767.1 mycofactocin system transcriptional regulator [Mycobacterium montefi
MSAANTGSLRDRRRAELLSQIQLNAYELFAARGFDAVTTEDIAAAAGISISTYFRHAPTKEGLLVDPVREAIGEIVGSYSARPHDESAVEALIQVFVTRARDADELDNLDTWRHAIATAPHLLSKTALVSEADHDKFLQQVAFRMGVDASDDVRPALLVHTSLATIRFVLDRWLSPDVEMSELFHVQLEQALRITLCSFD